jgi:hypothetical protein
MKMPKIGEGTLRERYPDLFDDRELSSGDENGDKMEPSAEEVRQKHVKLECDACCTVLTRACDFMLWRPEGTAPSVYSWGGKVRGHCMRCSKWEDDREFRKEAEKRFSEYTGYLKRRAASGRNSSFSHVLRELKLLNPGKAYETLRRQVLGRLRLIVICFAASVANDPVLRACSESIFDEYMSSIARSSIDPSFAGMLDSLKFAQGGDSTYLTSLSAYILCAYVCREAACGWYGLNSQWLQMHGRYKFACPHCGAKCQPTAYRATRIPASRVIGLCDPVSRSWKFMLAAWPSTSAENWLQKQATAFALSRDVPETFPVDDLVRSSLHDFRDVIRKVGTPSCFQHFEFDPAVLNRAGHGTYQAAHLEHGYWGRMIEADALKAGVFSEWDLMIELIGSVVVAGRHAAAGGAAR